MMDHTVKFRHEVIDPNPPGWRHDITLIADLFHPHSLETADFNGDGSPDIFVGETGLGRNPDPKIRVYAQ